MHEGSTRAVTQSNGMHLATQGLHDEIFAAALNADIPLLRRLLVDHRSASSAHGRSPLWIAVSGAHEDVVRVLLAVGVEVDAADASGTTPLMLASSTGYSNIIELCLAHGADPLRVRQDGQTAISLAAYSGRASSLGALFRFDYSLICSTDALRRNALHWAVIGGQTLTVKYLLGRWSAHVHLADADAEGNTPLHLCRGPSELALLLMYGGTDPPSLGQQNAAGLTPPEAALAAGVAPEDGVLSAMDLRNASRVDRRLFAFMHDSFMRAAPAKQRPPPWPRCIDRRAALITAWPSALLLLLVVRPSAALVIAAAVAFIIATSLVLPPIVARGTARLAPLLPPCCRASAEKATVRFLSVPPASRAWLLDFEHFPVPAALTLLGFLFLAAVSTLALVPHAQRRARLPLGLATLAADVLLATSYWHVITCDPGVLPGATDQDATLAWGYIEASSTHHTSVLASPFCNRSERLAPVRAQYSPLVRTLVKAFAHDCHAVGTAIGTGNHRAFFVLLAAAEAQLILFTILCCVQPSLGLPSPHGGLVSYIAALCHVAVASSRSRAICACLVLAPYPLVLLGLLLGAEAWQVAVNVTTVERLHWARSHARQPLPRRGSVAWREFARFDRGVAHNVASFLHGQREKELPLSLPESVDEEAGEGATEATHALSAAGEGWCGEESELGRGEDHRREPRRSWLRLQLLHEDVLELVGIGV